MDLCFSDCCRPNDDHHFIQENQWLNDSIQKFNFFMPDQYEHQNSTGYCFEEEKHYGKYKKMSKIFHCCSLAVLSLMMVEVICKIIFLPKHYFTHKLEMFDGLIGRVIKNFIVKRVELWYSVIFMVFISNWRWIKTKIVFWFSVDNTYV